MSEVVKKFPSNRSKYDWEKWKDGLIHQCVKGTDFQTEATAFSSAARKHAERYGLGFEGRIEGDSVYIRFIIVKNRRLKKAAK